MRKIMTDDRSVSRKAHLDERLLLGLLFKK